MVHPPIVQPPAAHQQRRSQFHAEPSGFQRLLHAQAPAIEQMPKPELPQKHAFAFSELGMFGLRGLDGDDGSLQLASTAFAGSSNGDAGETDTQAVSDGGDRKVLSQVSNLDHSAGLDVVQLVLPASPATIGQQAQTAFGPGVPALLEGGDPPTTEAAHSAGTLPKAGPPRPSLNAVSLIVSGPNEALAIAARSSCEQNTGALRKRLADVAAEYGMEVSELKLNGWSTDPSFRPVQGGQDGNRTR